MIKSLGKGRFYTGREVIEYIRKLSLEEVYDGNLQLRTFSVIEKYGGYPWAPKFLYYEVK